MNIAREKDVERLRQAALILERENDKLTKRLLQTEKELLALKGQAPETLQLRLEAIEAQLAQRNKALFGPKSEKQLGAKKPEASKEQTGHGPRAQPALPLEVVVYSLDEADRPCPKCGEDLPEWKDQHEGSEEVEVVERRFFLRRNLRQKYKCGCGHIETAPGPQKLHPGARYSIKFAVEVATQKYADHLPLERQVRVMAREGLVVDSQTLWDQIERAAKLLTPLYEDLQKYVQAQAVIGVDETHWRMLSTKGKDEGPNKRWQVWATCCADAVAYKILDSRGAVAAREVLGNFKGIAMCDGYAVYPALAKDNPQLRIANCFAHARRKFVEAQDDYPAQAKAALQIIAALYAIEREAKETGPPQTLPARRRKLREAKSKVVMQQLQDWAIAQRALPQSSIGRALSYLHEQWRGLQVYLDDPGVDIDNNATERALRGVVIGRKNHYGSKSQRGTEVAALFYSLIESCKLNGVDPKKYLAACISGAVNGQMPPLPHDAKIPALLAEPATA